MENGTGSGEWKGRIESGTWGIGNGNMKWEIENGKIFFFCVGCSFLVFSGTTLRKTNISFRLSICYKQKTLFQLELNFKRRLIARFENWGVSLG